MQNIIQEKYKIENVLGKGKFGVVYRGIHIKSGNEIAIKIEKTDNEIKSITHETTILNYLYKRGCRDIPFVYWYGNHLDYTCLVMTYFDRCIHSDNRIIGTSMSLDLFMIKAIEIMENIHRHSVVHRDIKPHNFMIGRDDELYLIDFGMANIYIDDQHNHIKTREPREYIIGTPRFISPNIHNGIEPVRRDDLISLGYVYLFLANGSLPWDECFFTGDMLSDDSCETDEMHICHPKNQFRKEMKQIDNVIDLCNQETPQISIRRYMEYCYRLTFSGEPHYSALRDLF